MTLFEKVLINLHRGSVKLKQGAVIIADRVKFEVAVVRVRLRMEDLRSRMRDREADIGRRVAQLQAPGEQPRTFEAFLKDAEVVIALEELSQLRIELDDLAAELVREQTEMIAAATEAKEAGEQRP